MKKSLAIKAFIEMQVNERGEFNCEHEGTDSDLGALLLCGCDSQHFKNAIIYAASVICKDSGRKDLANEVFSLAKNIQNNESKIGNLS